MRLAATVLLAALVLDGCVVYPAATPSQGQPSATFERDQRECRARAEDEVESPVLAGLKHKALWTVAGAVVGVGAAFAALAGSSTSTSDPEDIGIAIGIGAAVGLLVGTIVGTVKAGDEVSRVARVRRQAFSECMTERGYQVERQQ